MHTQKVFGPLDKFFKEVTWGMNRVFFFLVFIFDLFVIVGSVSFGALFRTVDSAEGRLLDLGVIGFHCFFLWGLVPFIK